MVDIKTMLGAVSGIFSGTPGARKRKDIPGGVQAVPLELWRQIFLEACTDGGRTGWALGGVSKYFREASRSVCYQSMVIHSAEQVLAFVSVLDSVPEEERYVRDLFVHTADDGDSNSCRSDDERTKERSKQRRETLFNAIHRLIQLVAPRLEILFLSSHVGIDPCATLTRLTRLSDLVLDVDLATAYKHLHRGFPSPDPAIEPLPQLKRLFIPHGQDCTLAVARAAPSLTHLRVAGINDSSVPYYVGRALSPCGSAEEEVQETLSPTLRSIILQPNQSSVPSGFICGTMKHRHYQMMSTLESLQRDHAIVTVLKAPSRNGTKAAVSMKDLERHWRDCVDGGAGCWLEQRGYRESLPWSR